jgi:ribosome maturation factor RimP
VRCFFSCRSFRENAIEGDEAKVGRVYRDIPPEVRALIEPVVEDHGFELVDVDLPKAHGGVLRVTIDTREGDGRVPIDRCAAVSREIETNLDAAGAVSLSYRLEVSSPGLDRLLAREKDFAAAAERRDEVKLETRRPLDGRRRFRGILLGFGDGDLRVEVEGREVRIPFAEVAKARTVYSFSRGDFRGAQA